VEISSSLVVVKMSGPAVREVLASHCPADLDPRVLPPGHHLRSHLADHPALIRHGPSGGFEVHLDRSLAESCLSRLTRTAAAFGIAFLQTAPKAAYHQPIKEQEQ
jgi:heterotetrameric sarcosine oxidase gamma subunit